MSETDNIHIMSTSPQTTISQEAKDKLSHELQTLKKELKLVMERLNTAREMGDLSENGAYKYAKFELGDIRRKIRDITRILETSVVLQKKDLYVLVETGCTVELVNNTELLVLTIVGEYEANPLDNKISLLSPIGKALKNKKIGDSVEVHTPSGIKSYSIKNIF